MRRSDTIVVIASGPSLTVDQVNYVRGRARVLAVSDNYRLAPWADWVYSSCKSWWDVHRDGVIVHGCTGELWTQDPDAAKAYGLHRIPFRTDGEGYVPGTCCGASSGEHAVSLAADKLLAGNDGGRIVLIGFDMGATGDGHWFGRHPKPLVNGACFPVMRKGFTKLGEDLAARGVEVINCTAKTALDCYPRMELAVAC